MLPHLAKHEITTPEEITSRVLDRLAVELADGGRSPATVATYMRDVKSFLRWLTAEGDLEKTPAVPTIAQPLRRPAVLTDAEYKHLVATGFKQHERDGISTSPNRGSVNPITVRSPSESTNSITCGVVGPISRT